jgi:hypothetical protein
LRRREPGRAIPLVMINKYDSREVLWDNMDLDSKEILTMRAVLKLHHYPIFMRYLALYQNDQQFRNLQAEKICSTNKIQLKNENKK